MQWLEPWDPVEATEDSGYFVAELQRELSAAHPLYGIPVKLLGRRDDREDFLFGLQDGSQRVAVVHLTFRRSVEPLPFPVTRLFEDLAEWKRLDMREDHAEWEP